MCSSHIKFGSSKADRRPEIQTLDDVYRSLKSTGSERDILICVDFNFPPDDEGWDELKAEDGMRFAIAPPSKTTVAVLLVARRFSGGSRGQRLGLCVR